MTCVFIDFEKDSNYVVSFNTTNLIIFNYTNRYISFKNLSNLVKLTICNSNMHEIDDLPDSLLSLKLIDCINLDYIANRLDLRSKLPYLKKLYIKRCNSLIFLPNLSNLTSLYIDNNVLSMFELPPKLVKISANTVYMKYILDNKPKTVRIINHIINGKKFQIDFSTY